MATNKRERQRANRAERQAEEAKAARRARTLRLVRRAAIVTVAVIAVGGVFALLTNDTAEDDAAGTTTTTAATTTTTGDGTTTSTTSAATPAANYAGYAALPVACDGPRPEPPVTAQYEAPDEVVEGDDPIRVTIDTSCGDLVLELDPAGAPETVNSFVFLAEEGYFDGTVFHRIAPGFVVQGGDPTATGTGGPGYAIPDELPPSSDAYIRGSVAMANAGANTSGSQFFIAFDDIGLTPAYSVFGTVVEGLDVLDEIEQIPTALRGTEQSAPLEALYIESVTVDR